VHQLYMDNNNYNIDDIFELVELQLDSRVAFSTPDASYSSINWPLYRLEAIHNIVGLKVVSASIPFTYYTFNSNNNTFTLTESEGGGAQTVTIPPGNYNVTTFITAAETALEAASTAAGNNNAYTVTYSGTTGKLTFVNDAGGVNTFTLTFGSSTDNGLTNPRFLLGFNAGAATSSTSQSLTAPNAAMIQGDNYIYINCGLGNGIKNYIPLTESNGGGGATPMIACVDVNVDAGEIITWVDENPQYFFSKEIDHISSIDFYLTLGNSPFKLDLNGQPFKLKIGILTRASTTAKTQTPSFQNRRVKRTFQTI
jgi:hypothetical protein